MVAIVSKKRVVGCLEPVSFPELKTGVLLAKVDTGAYSGALHCTNLKVVKRGPQKQRILKFTPLGNKALAQETDDFESTYIRSATGHRQRRYIITTTIRCGGKNYLTKIGLSDRSDMKREALLGRRFLRENNLLVDVRKNSELDDEGENTR
ncbi:ATP-dependent zinc protease [Candidatus Saccharibacteria bacterium]|nr:ATP-dependent zinc protease [Candidatus Saccharibacteria bacterium]MBJ58383.1 ATP-dependent zinc protease [Candidatus Saccharibacteria bacterium]MBQ68695.1 ATP-dependent zinc protease [Candidatus Saccharibacteria bacterium]